MIPVTKCCVCIAERHLEDHESVYQIHKSWASMDNNRFVFRKEFRKYDFFVNPSVSFCHVTDFLDYLTIFICAIEISVSYL